ncbi:hypothetical protein LINPERPRIM_LOCUS28392 [Linum perenne]
MLMYLSICSCECDFVQDHDHLHKGLFYMLAADMHTESSEISLLLLWVWWPEVLK